MDWEEILKTKTMPRIKINGEGGFCVQSHRGAFVRVLVYRGTKFYPGKPFIKTITLSDGYVDLNQNDLNKINVKVGEVVKVLKDKH